MEQSRVERWKKTSAAAVLWMGILAVSACGETPATTPEQTEPVPSKEELSKKISDMIYESYYGSGPSKPETSADSE